MKIFFGLILILVFLSFSLIPNKHGDFKNQVFNSCYERYDLINHNNWKLKFFNHDTKNNIWSVYLYKNDELFVKMFAQINGSKSIYMSNFFWTDITPDEPVSFIGYFLSSNDLVLVYNMKKFDNETLYFKKMIFIGEYEKF